MQKRTLGMTGLDVSAVGFGCMGNLAAVDIPLTAADLRDIDQAASHIEVQDARYPESLLRMVDR